MVLEHRPGGGREEHLGAKGTIGSAQRWKSTCVCDEGWEARGYNRASRQQGRGGVTVTRSTEACGSVSEDSDFTLSKLELLESVQQREA